MSGQPLHKTGRTLVGHPSIDETTNIASVATLQKQELGASGVAEPTWLNNWAEQHLSNFRKALQDSDRCIAPNRELRVATACTGSGAEAFTLLAIAKAFRKTGLAHSLKFNYVFHCEKTERNIISSKRCTRH